MLYDIKIPYSLERSVHAAKLQPIAAETLQWMDISTKQGRAIRGQGIARSDDVGGVAATPVACGVFNRVDCRRVLVVQDVGGAVNLHMGETLGFNGPPCAGPLPTWNGMELEPGDQLVYINSQSYYGTPAELATATVVNGLTYQIDCEGVWGRDPSTEYRCDADGEAIGGSGISSGPFASENYGKVFAHEPGNANALATSAGWAAIGKNGTIKATASGSMYLIFSDNENPPSPPAGYYYANNVGIMTARVRAL